jgi:c-di-GMP-binding flagellar brake protein YcgR
LFKQLKKLIGLQTAKETSSEHSDLQLLTRLCHDHALIDVKVMRLAMQYQSMILAVDVDNDELIIDQLFPAEKLDELEAGDSIEISCNNRGKVINFFSRILMPDHFQDTPCYRLELPRDIGQNQSRGAYRVYVDREQGLTIDLGSTDNRLLSAHIVNLSPEGLKLSFIDDLSGSLKANQCFEHTLITLPDGFDIECRLTVRNSYSVRSTHIHSLAGASIEIPNPQQRVKLNQYLAGVQRKQRRRENREL